METGRKAIKALAKEASLLPQEELLQVLASQEDLTIGIPKEISLQEFSVLYYVPFCFLINFYINLFLV